MAHEPDTQTSTVPDTRPERKVVHVRRGLAVEDLDREFRLTNRETDVGHYSQAVYLSDMEERGIHQLLGYSSAVHYARKTTDMSRRQARDLVAVGKALAELPQIDDAFCEGRISWTKARLLCGIAVPGTEKAWLEVAMGLSCDALERRIAGSEKGRPPREDGKGLPPPRFTVKVRLDALRYEVWEQAKRKVQALAGEPLGEDEVFLAIAEAYLKTPVQGEIGLARRVDASLYKVVIGLSADGKEACVQTDDGPVPIPAGLAQAIACDAPELPRAPSEATACASMSE